MFARGKEGKRPFAKPNGFRWAVVLFILVAFGLRLQNAELFSFWTDEGLTPLRSGYSISEILSNRVIIQEGVTNDTHPPFFFLIIHFSRQVFGETDFAYRYPSLLAGVLLVPLLAQVGKRMRGWQLGVVVAGLTTVNPLQIWYANEARMYTLAVLLVTAASYVLWQTINRSQRKGDPAGRPYQTSHTTSETHRLPARYIARQLTLFLLLGGLAFYTHYTAAILILGQGIFWLLILWRQGHKRLLGGTAVLGLLMAAPLVPYTIPRLFKGYEANFFYVSPWIMLQDVVRFFALGRSVDFESASIILLNIGAFFLLLVGLWGAKGSWRRPFLLIWLLAIMFGLMIGSFLFKPMYQGVRHIMLGSPAFLLLLGFGLVTLGEGMIQKKSGYRLLIGAGLAVSLAIVTAGPAAALNNYFNGRFGKDDFRSLIQFVEARAGANDVVVYNNAILLPLHDHYQMRPDLTVTASPVYPKWANSSPEQLAELAKTYDRIWFVTDPPADRRDENKLVQQWLDEELLLVNSTIFESHTVEVRARVYDTAVHQLDTLPETSQSLNLQWPNYPNLVGTAWRIAEPVIEPAIWLDLFWQGTPPSETDGIRFQLAGADGRLDWQVVETAVDQGNQSWQTEMLNRRSYMIPLPAGTPPGNYTVLAQPLRLSETPQVLAELAPIGELVLDTNNNARADWPSEPAQAIFENGVRLQTVSLADTAVRPGHALPITLFWQMDNEAALTDLQYELSLVAADGTISRSQRGLPGASWLTTWQPGQRLREPSGLYFPPDTQPGAYELRLQFWQAGEEVGGRPFWQPWRSDQVTIGQIEVTPWPLETELPENMTSIDAQFGDEIKLDGYDLIANSDAVQLTLYWRSVAVPSTNWFVFVHLVNEAGEIVVQRDLVPDEGLRPTTGWRASELITDVHWLQLPPDLPTGQYTVRVGLFEPESFARPSVNLNNILQADNQLELVELTLP